MSKSIESSPMMKTILTYLALAAAAFSSVFASDWEAEFRNPPDDYKPMPLWFINGELTTDGIRQQVTQAKQQAGFTGVSPLPWTDVKPHPLRRLVNGKKLSVPVFSSSGLPGALSGCFKVI